VDRNVPATLQAESNTDVLLRTVRRNAPWSSELIQNLTNARNETKFTLKRHLKAPIEFVGEVLGNDPIQALLRHGQTRGHRTA
jgi:hypothetical protein